MCLHESPRYDATFKITIYICLRESPRYGATSCMNHDAMMRRPGSQNILQNRKKYVFYIVLYPISQNPSKIIPGSLPEPSSSDTLVFEDNFHKSQRYKATTMESNPYVGGICEARFLRHDSDTLFFNEEIIEIEISNI